MQLLDWLVLIGTTLFITLYGLWKIKKEETIDGYLRSDHNLGWFTIMLSVISTQASAVTFLSAPGQAYNDGMRFVLFYLGMPLAMVFISVFIIPVYYRLNVVTAYEFLESKFDVKVRSLAVFFFLIQRSLAAGISIAAPAIVFSVILDWNSYFTNVVIGGLVVIYTVWGGSDAISQTQKLQMIVILVGMSIAGYLVVALMPANVQFYDAMHLAGKAGKLNTMDFSFDFNNKYTIWSGLIGGFFLQMAYFGTDQSQVGRYLGGSSMTQSRLGILLNGIFKIPMQFGILFIGAMLFVFYQFTQPPIFFNSVEVHQLSKSKYKAEYQLLEQKHQQNFEEKKQITYQYVNALRVPEKDQTADFKANFKKIEEKYHFTEQKNKEIKKDFITLLKKNNPKANEKDVNYIFLTFVNTFLPVGLIGLLIAVILFASMSTTASELNALASTVMVDIYKRSIKTQASDKHYIKMSKIFTILWGVFAIVIAQLSLHLGTLIEVVNMLGSWFYGTILGIFLMAFFGSKHTNSSSVFWAAIITQITVIAMDYQIIPIKVAFLWFNVIGCVMVITLSLVLRLVFRTPDKLKI